MTGWGDPSGEGPKRPSCASSDSFDALLAAAVSAPDGGATGEAGEPRFTRLAIGTTVSRRFVVEWFAGAGGMGAVYRCHDLEADEKVALKVIRKLDDQSRFRREASILASLSHPAIVRYVAHGSTEAGTPYLAMEWLDGEDLGRRLCRGRTTIAESLALMRGVCAGLVTAHAQGFVHRDIKPSNVYLVGGRFEAVKLLDFGIAHRGAVAQTMTRTGTVLGTVGYMAPEQAVGARAPDPRADLFSLGCVLFECLTGRPAFPGDHAVSVLESVLQSSVPDVRSLRPEAPPALAQLVVRLLDKDRESRPPDAASVLGVLDEVTRSAPDAMVAATHAPFRAPPPRLATVVLGVPPPGARIDGALAAALARRFMARASQHDGAPLFVLEPAAHAELIDRARLGAALAHVLAAEVPQARLAVATGAVAVACASASLAAQGPDAPGLTVDPLTRALLALRDEVLPAPDAMVGRDKELAVLDAVLAASVDESTAQAVLVTAPAGFGKSRLARALDASVRARGDAQVMALRAEPAPHSATHALACALGREHGMALRDPEALAAELGARCATAPLLVCIDDAQWADLASMELLAQALVRAADRPLLVLGFARPELSEPLRAVWRSLSAQTLSLRPLSDRAAARLVRARVPGDTPADAIDRVVALAQGSPRLLRVLAEAIAGGPEARLLATTLLGDQLAQLDVRERAVLAAAAALGPRVDPDGVDAILEGAPYARSTLAALRDRKLMLTERYDLHCAEFPLIEEILCDASLALLDDADRGLASRRAERWLAGEGAHRAPVTR